MLSGNSGNSVKVTVKFDGAPAIFVGTDPSDGQFFVGTKGVFNKNPKLVKQESDITELGYKGGLAEKLRIALKEMKSLVIDYKEGKETEISKLNNELEKLKKMVDESQDIYEKMLEKTTQSLEEIIKNTESSSKVQ